MGQTSQTGPACLPWSGRTWRLQSQLIDTASTYGDAESVFGSVIANEGFRDKVFIATKLEAPDATELKRSLSRLKTAKLDLLQLHNVRNRRQSLARFKAWKAQGVCRYVGVTSTFHGDFPAMEAVIAREQPDFVQIDYSLGDREAQKRILPLAAEIKAGVLTAQPFGSGRLFRAPADRRDVRYARHCRPAGVEGHITRKWIAALPLLIAFVGNEWAPWLVGETAGRPFPLPVLGRLSRAQSRMAAPSPFRREPSSIFRRLSELSHFVPSCRGTGAASKEQPCPRSTESGAGELRIRAGALPFVGLRSLAIAAFANGCLGGGRDGLDRFTITTFRR
jgi:Aldo/keto reductase family